MSRTPSKAERLLSQVSWIRELASHLVADRDLAEDLVQETCVVALENGPRDESQLKGWLASVMRNLVRKRARTDVRRADREAERERPREAEGAERIVENLAMQRHLVGVVMELDEPYREAIVLRFFEEKPPREIARSLGVPVITVNRRLTRALAQLRERLDREHGHDRRAWLALVLPLAEGADPIPTLTLGGLFVNTKLTLAAVAALAIGTTAAFVHYRGDRGVPRTAESAAPDLAAAETERSLTREEAPEVEYVAADPAVPREALPVSATPSESSEPGAAEPLPELLTVRGRVLNGEGSPVGGVSLCTDLERSRVLVESDAGGGFSFETSEMSGRLMAFDDAWVTVRSGVWKEDASYEPLVVLAPAIDLEGSVVSESGQGLEGALVSLNLPPEFEVRFEDILDSTHESGWSATSRDDGRFSLGRIPSIPGAFLRCSLDGYAIRTLPAPPATDRGLRFVLAPPEVPLEGALRGRVVYQGEAVPEARVAIGLTSVLTDPNGDFEIDLRYAVTADLLTAVRAGYLPAVLERPGEPTEDSSGWPEFCVLELPGEALSISGRLLDFEGKPLKQAKVWVEPTRQFGVIGMAPVPLEGLLAGAAVPPMVVESAAYRPAEDGNNYRDQSYRASETPNCLWHWVSTDGEGRFELPGLTEAHYPLIVMPQDSIQTQTTEPIRAGRSGVEIRLPKPDVYQRLAGHVLDEEGDPIPGVVVNQWIAVSELSSRVFGGRVAIQATREGESTVTDEDGAFSFDNVPRDRLNLSLHSDDIVPASFRITDEDDPRDVELNVTARMHLQVMLDPPYDRADSFAFTDVEGGYLDVLILTEGSHQAFTSGQLVQGKSRVVSVSSRAATLHLLSEGERVDSVPLSLQRGEINVIRH